jgi:hypothetical protein
MRFLLPLLLLFVNSTVCANSLNVTEVSHVYDCPSGCIDKSSIEVFNHNFCESRLQNDTPPEIYNSITSLAVTIVPVVSGFPEYHPFYNVATMFVLNGFASCYYHYYLTWLGKQADEITMILANYYGMSGLIDLGYSKSTKRKPLHIFNTLFMYGFMVFNTLIQNDQLFPTIFGVYIVVTLYMIRRVAYKYNASYKRYLFVSFVGASCWIISEEFCNEYTVHGHSIWHLLFPLGLYRLILKYDKLREIS